MWQLNVALNTAKSALPFQASLRQAVRIWRGYPITGNAPLALAQGLQQIEDLAALGVRIEGRTVLDLGSGWHPIVPLLYRAGGASLVHLSDTERLIDAAALDAAASWLRARAPLVAKRLGVLPDTVLDRLDAGPGPLQRMLNRLHMTYQVPLAPAVIRPVDIVVSRVVLEHVKPTALARLHRESASALGPEGIVAHIIDNSDHREHHDKRLSRIDFLRYRNASWRLLCLNPQDYCSRLRHSDHIGLLRAAGFVLLLERRDIDPKALKDTLVMRLASPWRNRSPEDLAAMTSWLVARLSS